MNTYAATYEDGRVELLGARTLAQAIHNAAALRPNLKFTAREATAEESASLLAAHSLPLDAGDE